MLLSHFRVLSTHWFHASTSEKGCIDFFQEGVFTIVGPVVRLFPRRSRLIAPSTFTRAKASLSPF